MASWRLAVIVLLCLVSLILLAIGVAPWSLALIAIGSFMNLLVVIVNGNRMPVMGAGRGLPPAGRHVPVITGYRMLLLADRLPVPLPRGRLVLSLGDVVSWAGILLLLLTAI